MEKRIFDSRRADALVVMEDIETAIRKVRSSFEKAEAVFEKFASKVYSESLICGSDMLELFDVDGLKLVEDEVVQELYRHLGAVCDCLHKTSYIRALTSEVVDEVLQEINPDWSIEVAEIDGSLVVKTPPLLNYFTSKIYVKGVQGNRSYSKVFANEVLEKMKKKFPNLIDKREKTVALLAIYPTSMEYIPDTNNLDTKSIVDAITYFYDGGDSALSCSFVSMSMVSDDVKEGCYFVVYDGFGVPVSTQNLSEKASKVGKKHTDSTC